MVSRRAFVALATLAGLGALVSRDALLNAVRGLGPARDARREPLLARLEALAERLNRGEISAEQFVRDVQARFAATDLPAAFADRLAAAPNGSAVEAPWSTRVDGQWRALMLFFIAPGHAHPPHAHHQVASTQCVLRGSVRVRQYERLARLDPRTLALRKTRDAELRPYDTILATEMLDNVHWFGAEAAPAVVLNWAINGGLGDGFDPAASRPVGRYFVDPCGAAEDGRIVAPEIDAAAARARFATRPLSAFA